MLEAAKHVWVAACIWGLGTLLYGVVEVLTNTVSGLYQPAGVWAVVLAVYGVLGFLAGIAGGGVLFVGQRLRRTSGAPHPPAIVAAFFGAFLFAYVALPINDRELPDFLSLSSILINGTLAAICAGVSLLIFRQLRDRPGVRLAISFLNLSLWVGLFLTVAFYIDTYLAGSSFEQRATLLDIPLAGSCVVGYLVIDRVVRAVGRTAPARVLPAAAAVALVVVGASLAVGTSQAPQPTAAPGRPNVLWIVMDTVRADHLSTYGYTRPTTPNIDALAADSTLFENAIAQSSWTIPSHFQMVTSRFAAGKGMVLAPDFLTAAEMFKERGYATAGVLANFVLGRRSGFEQGFDTFRDGPVMIFYLRVFMKIPVAKAVLSLGVFPVDRVLRLLDRETFLMDMAARAEAVNDRVLEWLAERPAKPFFLFINYMDAHDPYDPLPAWRDRFASGVNPESGFVLFNRKFGGNISSSHFVRDVLPAYRSEDWNNLVALYDAELAYLDDQIGRLVSELKRQGLFDQTILILTSDHGELFGEHGLANHFKSLSDEEIHVPLIMHYPGTIPAGRRVRAPVELSDILPTLFDLLDFGPAPAMDGTSLRPLLRVDGSGDRDGPDAAFSFLIRKPDRDYPHTAPGNLIGIRTLDLKYVWSSTGQHAYYDLRVDPGAANNEYGTVPEPLALETRLDEWRKRVGLERLDAKEGPNRLTEDRLRTLGYVQ